MSRLSVFGRVGRAFLASLPLAGVLLALSAGTGTVAAAANASSASFVATPISASSTETGTKSSSANLATTDPSLLGQTSSAPVNVLIKYDYDATASYTGGVAGPRLDQPQRDR